MPFAIVISAVRFIIPDAALSLPLLTYLHANLTSTQAISTTRAFATYLFRDNCS